MTSADLQTAVTGAVADPPWLADALSQVAASPAAVAGLFPAVSRHCGRGPLPDPDPELAGWTVDDAARVLLLTTLSLHGAALAGEIGALYRLRGRGREACGAARAAVAGHRGQRGRAAA